MAKTWLEGAFCHLGAGAKTNAGYGSLKPAEGERPSLLSLRRATFETTLALVAPAFLAGAQQKADDCDLRPATLRGKQVGPLPVAEGRAVAENVLQPRDEHLGKRG